MKGNLPLAAKKANTRFLTDYYEEISRQPSAQRKSGRPGWAARLAIGSIRLTA
jgi:hypothetical protein